MDFFTTQAALFFYHLITDLPMRLMPVRWTRQDRLCRRNKKARRGQRAKLPRQDHLRLRRLPLKQFADCCRAQLPTTTH